MELKVSVITVCYNAALVIENTICSVINQSYSNIEYVIIDGGSKDGTCDIIEKYRSKVSFYLSESDHGIYDAMNKGITQATGDYVIFINAGDELENSDTLLRFTSFVERESADVFYGDVLYKYKYGERLVKADRLKKIEYDMVFSHQSVFIRTRLLKTNLFNLKYKLAADYDLLLRLYRLKCSFVYLDFPISKIEVDQGATYSNFMKSKKETRVIQISNGTNSIIANAIFYYKIPRLYLGKLAKSILPDYILSSHFKVKK